MEDQDNNSRQDAGNEVDVKHLINEAQDEYDHCNELMDR